MLNEDITRCKVVLSQTWQKWTPPVQSGALQGARVREDLLEQLNGQAAHRTECEGAVGAAEVATVQVWHWGREGGFSSCLAPNSTRFECR